MKKFAFIFGVAFVATLAFSSCKKDYTCSCTYKDITDQTATIDLEIKDAKKKDAEDACDALKATWALVDAGLTCELK
jgi:hypothetical protein